MFYRISEFKYKAIVLFSICIPKKEIQVVENNMRSIDSHCICIVFAYVKEILYNRLFSYGFNGFAIFGHIIRRQHCMFIVIRGNRTLTSSSIKPSSESTSKLTLMISVIL